MAASAKRPRMRPLFEIAIDVDGERVFECLRAQLARPKPEVLGKVLRNHATLELPPNRRAFWSPYLNLEIGESGGRPTLHGRFSPHPSVWTLFMAVYGVILIAGCAGLIWGLSQITLGQTPWALAAVPASIALGGFVYGAVFIGQGLSAHQMYDLRAAVDRAVRDAHEQHAHCSVG